MKGYTDIELTNVKTGEVQKYHDENMLTNGVMHALSQSPYSFGTFHKERNRIMADKQPSWLLMGGLLLFDKQLEENPETLVPPDGVKMVGNAVAGVSNSSGVPEFGNFDAKASTYEVSGKTAVQKFVYTFDTTQANGTIASVCLASAQAGYYGFGNHSGRRITNGDDWRFKDNYFPHGNIPFNDSYVYDRAVIPFNDYDYDKVVYVDYKKNFAILLKKDFWNIQYNTQNAKIVLGKVHVPLSKTGVISMASFATLNKNMYEKAEISLPDTEVKALTGKIADMHAVIVTDNNKSYIVWHGYFDEKRESNKRGIHIWEITSDLQLRIKKTVAYDTDIGIRPNWCTIKDGVLYASVSEYKNSQYAYYIDEIDIASGTKTRTKMSEPVIEIGKYMDKITAKQGNLVYIYDTVFKKLLPINATNKESYNPIDGVKHLLINNNRLCTAPAYLATINNLSEPVVKTPELVMKITYTLTTELEA
nr:MAG TPA: hypothetical protein [Caudoviricetes sp.]